MPRVIFTNRADYKVGKFTVSKVVGGVESEITPLPRYSFTYSCVKGYKPAVEGRIENVPGDGSEVPAGKRFPVGSVCTVTEDKAVAAVASYDLAEVAPVVVTLGKKDESFGAVFENAYTKQTGSFVVGKEVKGVATGKVSEPVVVPVGAVCEVSEADSAVVAGYVLAKPEPVTVKVAVKDEVVKAEFVNEYSAVKAPAPKQPKPKLPNTGAAVGVLAGVSVVLLAAGVLLVRKRRV